MPDSFSSRLRLRLQATGGNNNVWGAYLNTAVAQLLEDSIAGFADITVASSDVTLSTSNGASDQARMAILRLSGTPGAARNIVIPQAEKFYFILNDTDATMTIKSSASGTPQSVTVDAGSRKIVVCDDTDVIEMSATATNALALGGVSANQWARLNAAQTFSKGQRNLGVALSMGATVAVNMAEGNIFTGVLTESAAISSPVNVDATGAQVFEMILSQAPSGGPFGVSFDPFYDFIAGTPIMPTGANEILYVHGIIVPSLSKAICFAVSDVSDNPSVLTLSVNESNVNAFRRLGSPSGVVDVAVVVGRGVLIKSDSTAMPALDLSGFASGSTVTLYNNGFIVGKGGRGGNSPISVDIGSADPWCFGIGRQGMAGGDAIKGPGSGCALFIVNANGRIWGGGGGGGSGGASVDGDEQTPSGGPGGGGAGFGEAGLNATAFEHGGTSNTSSAASPGTIDLSGGDSGGSAGAGSSGNGYSGAGGDGGDFGANGTDGTAAATHDATMPPGSGGVSGKAVEQNSATVSFVSGSGSPNVKGAVS